MSRRQFLAQSGAVGGALRRLVASFGQVLAGGRRIAQLYHAVWRRSERDHTEQRIGLVRLNGQWGLLCFIGGQLESAQRITRIYTQRNPDKLRHVTLGAQR